MNLKEAQEIKNNPSQWPEPTTDEPDIEQLQKRTFSRGKTQASDGCLVEPDGVCPHGHPSWLVRKGLR